MQINKNPYSYKKISLANMAQFHIITKKTKSSKNSSPIKNYNHIVYA